MAKSNRTDELCDMCSVVNDFPAVVGFDLNKLEKNMVIIYVFFVLLEITINFRSRGKSTYVRRIQTAKINPLLTPPPPLLHYRSRSEMSRPYDRDRWTVIPQYLPQPSKKTTTKQQQQQKYKKTNKQTNKNRKIRKLALKNLRLMKCLRT